MLNKYALLAGLGDLQDKLSVVTYIQQHLQMVIWFYKMGLLPERDGQFGMLSCTCKNSSTNIIVQ